MLLRQKEIVNQLKELGYYYSVSYSDQHSVVFVDNLDDLNRDIAITGNYDDQTITFTNSLFDSPHIPTKVLTLIIEFVKLGEEIFWETLPVDAKVLVSDDGKTWLKRYFARYDNGNCYVWDDGKTSWTANKECENPWVYIQVLNEEKGI